ncbi:MAG: hypothetical protein KDE20_09050 [Caldilineaceae bacterium]|nr:hypothetical protein [Caldilineaceae bacterium]
MLKRVLQKTPRLRSLGGESLHSSPNVLRLPCKYTPEHRRSQTLFGRFTCLFTGEHSAAERIGRDSPNPVHVAHVHIPTGFATENALHLVQWRSVEPIRLPPEAGVLVQLRPFDPLWMSTPKE